MSQKKIIDISQQVHRVLHGATLVGSYIIGLSVMYFILIDNAPDSRYKAWQAWFTLWCLGPLFLFTSSPNGEEKNPAVFKYLWIGALALCYMAFGMATFLMGRW